MPYSNQNPRLKSSYIPDDLLVEIFTKTPVKSVCRMRCVCNSWNSIISSPSFIAHHLHNNSVPAAQKSYLVFKRTGEVNSYAFSHPHQRGLTGYEFLPFKRFPFRSFIFIDIIHGVVCLTSPIQNPSSPIILWNPTIRKYIKIPNPPFECSHHEYSLGLGFHTRKSDFRVIRLWMTNELLHYQLFSPQDMVWKKAVSTTRIPPSKVISEKSLFMNGTIHWILSTYKDHMLLMFDCEREEFDTMTLPRAFNSRRNGSVRLVLFKFRGMLLVMIFTGRNIEFWVLEEYGVSGSWRRLPLSKGKIEFRNLVSEESMLLMDANEASGVVPLKTIVMLLEGHENMNRSRFIKLHVNLFSLFAHLIMLSEACGLRLFSRIFTMFGFVILFISGSYMLIS